MHRCVLAHDRGIAKSCFWLPFKILITTSSTNVYAVSNDGSILHYNGSTWQTELDSGLADELNAIWGTSSSNIYAVGRDDVLGQGIILHYDGTLWTKSYISSGGVYSFYAVWGTSNSDIFVNGNDCILHFNGLTWTKMTSSPPGAIGFWGSSPSNVYSVDYKGGVYKYNGSYWAVVRDQMYDNDGGDIWGSSATDIFIVGDYGPSYYDPGYDSVIYHFNGNNFQEMNYPTSNWLGAVWGSSNSDVYAVGGDGTIVHYNGNTWSLVSTETPPPDSGSEISDTLQGFDKIYYLTAKLAALQANDSSWIGKTIYNLESLLNTYGFTPESHYSQYGYKEGLEPNQYFSHSEYVLAKAAAMNNSGGYPSVDAARAAFNAAWPYDAYQHYLLYGAAEGINPSNSFDESAYLADKLAALRAEGSDWDNKTIDDLRDIFASYGMTVLDHYLLYGRYEGLTSSPVVSMP